MRNTVLMLVMFSCLIVTGCGWIKEYSLSEQVCLDNSWTLADDNFWNKACIFSDWKNCPLAAIDDWDCFLIDEDNDEAQYSCSEASEDYLCEEGALGEDIDFEGLEEKATNIWKLLWGLTPQDALEYMKNTPNLVIVDVRDLEVKPNWFKWALSIPYNQLVKRVDEILVWRPVLLYCWGGNLAPKWYAALLEFNPEIPELWYIAWTPLFDEYNAWVK